MAAAGLAVAQVDRQPATLTGTGRAVGKRLHRRSHGHASLTCVDLVEAVAQPPTGAEQQALDRAVREAHPVADLVVGEPFQLSHHENLVLRAGKVVERHAQRFELASACDLGVRARHVPGEAALPPAS